MTSSSAYKLISKESSSVVSQQISGNTKESMNWPNNPSVGLLRIVILIIAAILGEVFMPTNF